MGHNAIYLKNNPRKRITEKKRKDSIKDERRK